MTPEVQTKIVDVIQQLAQKLGTTAEYLWPRLVGYERTEAICGLVILGVVLLVYVAAAAKLVPIAFRLFDDKKADEAGTILILVAVVGLIMLIATSVIVPESMATACYPESAAIRRIARAL